MSDINWKAVADHLSEKAASLNAEVLRMSGERGRAIASSIIVLGVLANAIREGLEKKEPG